MGALVSMLAGASPQNGISSTVRPALDAGAVGADCVSCCSSSSKAPPAERLPKPCVQALFRSYQDPVCYGPFRPGARDSVCKGRGLHRTTGGVCRRLAQRIVRRRTARRAAVRGRCRGSLLSLSPRQLRAEVLEETFPQRGRNGRELGVHRRCRGHGGLSKGVAQETLLRSCVGELLNRAAQLQPTRSSSFF